MVSVILLSWFFFFNFQFSVSLMLYTILSSSLMTALAIELAKKYIENYRKTFQTVSPSMQLTTMVLKDFKHTFRTELSAVD